MCSDSQGCSCSVFKINLEACCLWKIYIQDSLTVHNWDIHPALSPPGGCWEEGQVSWSGRCVWGCSLIYMLVGGCSALKPHFQWLWGRPIIRALHWSLSPSPLRHTPTEIPSISGEWICMNVAPPTRESDKCEQLQKGLGMGRCLVLSRGNLEPVSPVWLGDRSKLL